MVAGFYSYFDFTQTPHTCNNCNTHTTLITVLSGPHSFSDLTSCARVPRPPLKKKVVYALACVSLWYDVACETFNWFICVYIYFDNYVHILLMQLSRCVEEFESLVNLSSSLLDSQEPTAAMLFGPEGVFYIIIFC